MWYKNALGKCNRVQDRYEVWRLTGCMSWPKKRPRDKALLASKEAVGIQLHAVPLGAEPAFALVQVEACRVSS
jgi:hypothetical protein